MGANLEKANQKKRRPSIPLARLLPHVSTSCLAILFVLGLSQFHLDGLKGIFVDAQFRLRPGTKPHPDIALIAYDDKASARSLETTKIPAEHLARIFDVLTNTSPIAVGVIGTINEKLYTDSELHFIADSFSQIKHTLVGFTDDESIGSLSPVQMFQAADYFPGFISRDNFSYGRDSVSRRLMLSIGGLPTLYSELARIYLGKKGNPKFRHAHQYGDSGSEQIYINWRRPTNAYPTHSSEDVMRGKVPVDAFKNKIVLVGRTLHARQSEDYVLTPLSRNPSETPLLQGAAQGLATLLEDAAVFKTPDLFNLMLSLFLGVLTVNMVLLLSPVRGILFIFSEVVVLFIIAWSALTFFNCWINLAHPFLVACFGYYLVIPYRLVDEYRKRWHYQNKSEMMAQLEQLKSNFLSLVSHDLKTPLARIQGRAELLLNRKTETSNDTRKDLSAIVETTENMSQYVQTILDVTRIDSDGMPIHLMSKDINATVRGIVRAKLLQAEEKNISIETELEPIFSFKYDPDLIRRVLGNLVENAIKYSPSDSVVTLKTTEDTNWVKVSVEDNGAGIPEEDQDSIFTKFYRCQNEITKKEAGTGLGLYLVKYFVELHKGFVELKSKPGSGSIFTVALPV